MSLDILVIVAGKGTTRLGNELINREECLYDTGLERNRKKTMSLLTTVIKISDREMYKGRKLPYMASSLICVKSFSVPQNASKADKLFQPLHCIRR